MSDNSILKTPCLSVENTPDTVLPEVEGWKVNFVTIFIGQAFSLLGSQIVQFAIIWWMARTTGSATTLSLSMLSGILPMVIIGPFLGVLVDRWNRRSIMIASDLLCAVGTAVLILLYSMNIVQVWHVYVVLFIRAIAGTFHDAAFQATISMMVPAKRLINIAGIRQALIAVMTITAPPLGALLVATMSMPVILSIDIITCILAILPFFVVSIPLHQRKIDKSILMTSIWKDFREGVIYVISWKGLFALCGMWTAVYFLIGPMNALLPIMITKYFGSNAGLFAVVEIALSAGTLVGAGILGFWKGFNKKIITTLLSVIGIGISIIFFGLSPYTGFKSGVVAIFFAGMMLTIAEGPIVAMIQSMVPHEIQGRVLTLMRSVSTAAIPVGLIISGPLADFLGVSKMYLYCGITCVFIGAISLLRPVIMNLETNAEAVNAR